METEVRYLVNDEGERVLCNGGRLAGRMAVLQASVELTRRGGLTKRQAVMILQGNVRVMIARRVLARENLIRRGLSNRDTHDVVHQARAALFWEKYVEACTRSVSAPIQELRHQTSGSSITLKDYKLALNNARSLGGLLAEMSYQQQLRELDLSYNELRAAGVCALVDALLSGQSDCLETLIIKGNPISRETSRDTRPNHPTENRLGTGTTGAEAIARLIEGARNLQYLCMSDCKMGDACLELIAAALENNDSVQILSVADNNSERPGRMSRSASALGKMFAANVCIVEADLSGNGFGGGDGTALFGDEGKWKDQGLQWNYTVRRLIVSRDVYPPWLRRKPADSPETSLAC